MIAECVGEMSHSMAVTTQLRKIALHPLLVRHHYDENTLRKMAADILCDPSHYHAVKELVLEDMIAMSDFELDRLSKEIKVCVCVYV